jgi:hypothetical protein
MFLSFIVAFDMSEKHLTLISFDAVPWEIYHLMESMRQECPICPERKLTFQRCRGLVYLYTGSQIAIIIKKNTWPFMAAYFPDLKKGENRSMFCTLYII